jgi:2-methylcitrate synthase
LAGDNVSKEIKSAGMRDAVAGATAICTIGIGDEGFRYRGYSVEELTERATFEEVAYLLLYGKLPNAAELAQYVERLRSMSALPAVLKEVLERIPGSTPAMDMLRTGVSMLGTLEPEGSTARQLDVADRLVAALPSMLGYWWRFARGGERVETVTADATIAGQVLRLVTGREPTQEQRRFMDVSLVIYADHEFNTSTFVARSIAATLSDMYSAVTGAIGALRGPLHGGANQAAMELVEKFKTPEEAVAGVRAMLARKERIMGFGHAVYRERDPRTAIYKQWAHRLSATAKGGYLYDVSAAIEKLMWDEKRMFANADFYNATAYHFAGIPTPLFTALFACARISGWCAHVMEQRVANKLIRPAAEYIGPGPLAFVALGER